jgi:hypothetical protein
MLNTDLHNDGVVKKMSLADFLRNNRGINDGEDVPKDFLSRLYNNIKYDEIQLKADGLSHQNVHSSAIDYDGLVSPGKKTKQQNTFHREGKKKLFVAGMTDRAFSIDLFLFLFSIFLIFLIF